MVFENLVVYLLDKYLSDYIENLDTKKLQIDLWNGNVVLEKLYLKPNALADLNLPVTVSLGYLEKLTLQVPWSNLYVNPTKVTIDGLYLLVVPKTEVEYDAKRDEKERHEAKMKEVHKIEELRKEQEALKNAATADKTSDTFVERMQLQVIRNLELSIRNIHVVYEDKSTKPNHPFAFGFTLNYITLHTTTSDWKPTILKEDTPLIHKLGELSALSVYWNTNAQSRSGLPREEALNNLRAKIAVDNQRTPTDISYILRPLNIKAKVILVMKPRQNEFKQPMFDIKVDLDEISLNINRDQYSDLLDLLEVRDYLSLQSKYIKYRIKNDVDEKLTVKKWKFAYEAIVNEEIRPRFECYKWENIKLHLDRCREYRSLHFQDLLGKATVEQKQQAEELEKKLDVFNLTYIRRSAEIEAKKKKEQEPKTWWGSVSNWWGGNKPQDNPDLDFEKVMSPDEKKKLYDAIGYEGEDTSTLSYPEEYIDIDLAIRLNLLDVNVWSKLDKNDTQFRIIARAVIPDTGLVFKRRPATTAIAAFVDLGSFQVFGIASDLEQPEFSNDSRPVLAQPVSKLSSPSSSSKQEKLLKVEFETNPLDKLSDYRVKVVAQSLEIKYNAPTINKLTECFEQDTQRNLQGVKQVAYSTYTDVKHRSYILMKHNIEKIKVLDIDIDIQSAYFLLAEKGVYQEGVAAICMDFGHLTLKRKTNNSGEQVSSLKGAKDIQEARERSYTQFQLKLENVQLIYANRNESWKKACIEKNTSLHLIRPMELDLDVGKCLYSDDAILPAWKVAGKLPSVVLRLSDKRLFQIINHIQSIEFPQSKNPTVPLSIESEPTTIQSSLNNPEQTLEAVEGMTPVKKTKEKAESEENKGKKVKTPDTNEKKKEFEGQLTQLEAAFTLDRIDVHIDESAKEENEDEPFLRLTLESIVAKTKIKTFDMEFDASLANLIVYHEQFVGKDNQQLRLLSAQLEQTNNYQSQKLVSLNLLHTSSENPLFLSPTYDGIENRAHVHFSKLVVTLQLEALLSILRFQDSLMKKLPQDTSETQPKERQDQKQIEDIKNSDKTGKNVKKNDVPAAPSVKIDADLEEFRIILASKQAKLFDIQVQGVKAYVSQAPEKTLVNLILSDLRILDPYKNARYRKIISQQGDDKELLRVDLSLFNYPSGYDKTLETFDCDVKVQFAKANIVFLFKHIDAVLGFLNSLNITKAALNIASTQADAAYEQVQKLQEQAFKVHLDITFNAPNIIIPTNSHSDQALLLDLGKLTLKTSFDDDPKKSLVERQNVRLEKVLASRVKLDRDCNIIGEAILLECAELNTLINRLLYPEKVKTEPGILIKVEWGFVHFRLAKDDYSCVMRVLMENFSENIRDEMPDSFQNEQYRYRQEIQEKEEDKLRNDVIKKQKESLVTDVVVPTLKLRAEIKKLALTLYLGESDLSVRRGPRNDNLKLAYVEIETLEAIFRQSSDGSYKATARVKNFLLDDLRETNKSTSVTRMMDRHFTVDPNTHMFIASFEFQPRSQSRSTGLRQLTAQLESLYICISLDYLMTLQDFFISGLPSGNVETKKAIEQPPITTMDQVENDQNRTKIDNKLAVITSKTSSASSKPTTTQNAVAPDTDSELETRMDVIVKNPEIILLEDQHNSNSNCLVLDLALQLRMIMIGNETQLYGWLKNLTVYSSNYADIRDSNNIESKIKYRILQPAKVDVFLSMNNEQQKMDVRISEIIVSIAPAAIRTLIGVTSSLGTLQAITKDQIEKIDSKALFDPKSIKDANFWFTKDYEQKSQENNEPQQQAITQETNQIKESEEIKKPLTQKLMLALETIQIKLEVGLGSVTKSVVAMCLSNLTADVQNWSSNMILESTVNVEAALYNENMLAWEPLIEPTVDADGASLSPWYLACSISPALPLTETAESSPSIEALERKESVSSSKSKQNIVVRADQLLNITITKTGLDLVQRLSALFNDVYNKRLPPSDDADDQSMLSLFNETGQDIFIDCLDGLQFANNPSLKSIILKYNESIPLNIFNEHQTAGRLSVIDEQNVTRRQEFTVKIQDAVKTVSISRTVKRVYDLGQSFNPNWPIQMLCDTQMQNERRRITLSSIVRIYNNTTLPLLVLSVDATDPNIRKRLGKVEINKDYHVPIDLLYTYSSLPIFIAIDEGEEIHDFFSFDWEKEYAEERMLKLKSGNEANFIVFKELIGSYTENTDQFERAIFNLHVHSALYLTNLLPIDIECSIDNGEQLALKPSQLHLCTSGKRSSNLVFTIPSYDNIKWISEPVDLKIEGKGDKNEHLVVFHSGTAPESQQILRMILRVDAYHESYRLLIFSPFWIVNRTDLKIDFQIENNRTFIDVIETPYLVCPESFTNEASKKGQICVHSLEQTDVVAKFSEKFSLDVIKSTGLTSCKVSNNRTYMICVDIATSSFGLTKLVTLSPAMVIVNKSTVGIEIVEVLSDQEQDQWETINPDQLIPFWPRNIKDILARIRYVDTRVTSSSFKMNQKHRTLLRMDDEEHPAIFVEVAATDFDGVKIIFEDYKIGDAPLLIVNCLAKEPVGFCQITDVRSEILPPLHYVYYTWIDPLKPRELLVSCESKSTKIDFNSKSGIFDGDGGQKIAYKIFDDGIQTVLLFVESVKIQEADGKTSPSSVAEVMDQHLKISIHDIGISIVNDITHEEMLYISLNKSKAVWTEMKKNHVKPLSNDINAHLEELYRNHTINLKINPNDKTLERKIYEIGGFREVSFRGDVATLVQSKHHRKTATRQALDGLSIDYSWSASDSALHIRINRVQIDNQLDYTIFPVMLYPIPSKGSENDHAEKPFVELSVYQSKAAQSNIMQFKYFKILIQEFAVQIDQGLIVAILGFFRTESSSTPMTINMNTDLEQIKKPLYTIIKGQIESPSSETEMLFDNIHLSPLKIHVSFSMHGSKPTEELLAEYPLVGFLLRTLNVAEVQDVILRLGYYERNHDKFTTTKITKEVTAHYQNQFMKQIHVLVLGLDVLGNPLGVIRGLAEGVESFFYEPYKGAVQGPMEFAEGVATGVRVLFGSAVGGAAGAFSKITSVVGKGLANLTFDEDYKASRIRRKEPGVTATTHIAMGGKNVVMGFVDGVKGVVSKPIRGAQHGGASGFFKGLGQGVIGLVARPTGGVVDFASTSLDLIKRTAQQEEIIRRARYPRHLGRDGLVRPYISHEAMGFYILNRLEDGKYSKSDTYVAHITCSESPQSCLLATSIRLLFVTEISFLGLYEIDWEILYEELKEEPVVKINTNQIQILITEPKTTGTIRSHQTYGKLVKFMKLSDAKYIVDKIATAMHIVGL
ncbi:unnamed protein product [Rotaria magnacalcarata]|uniref:Vacuolar protein sorting-associated protein 13A n=1 Tax=Rotaria magnacalcarata TaxID=392030 RepID=A0A814X728_9BILA|nr:unnamed protein product [Rotaria magnacalcarata]